MRDKISIPTEHRTLEKTDIPDHTADLLDVIGLLARDRVRIILITVVVSVITAVGSSLIRPEFSSTAQIIPPPRPQSSMSALFGQLGLVAGFGGVGSLLRNPADMYVGVLRSRTVADRLIQNFNLLSAYHVKRALDAREVLEENTKIEAARNGLITIVVEDHDPNLASDLANAYVDELYRITSTLSTEEATERRSFFDQKLDAEKKQFANAENDLSEMQRKTGLVDPAGQVRLILTQIAQTRAEIASREVQLESMRTFATNQNPDLNRFESESLALKHYLSSLENDQKHISPGDTEIPSGQLPASSLEYLRKLRDVQYHEAMFQLLSRQYEAARIDQAKPLPVIQVIDRAVPADKKSSPQRMLLTLALGAVAFCGAIFWSVTLRAWILYKSVAPNASRLEYFWNT
jgi:tyrosine-protein kinase Etk/Wzc